MTAPRRGGSPARRRREEVFGDVLPETTAEERESDDEAGRGAGRESGGDAWLRDNVPPHHG